jgi:hypothetical protein
MATKTTKTAKTASPTFDRARVREVRAELEVYLEVLGGELGVNVSLGDARWNHEEMRFGITVTRAAKGGGKVVPQMELDFQRYAFKFGLKATDLGREFTCRDREFKIVGLRPRATRCRAIIGESERGAHYVFDADMVKRNLAD